jgi:hypothetical protein
MDYSLFGSYMPARKLAHDFDRTQTCNPADAMAHATAGRLLIRSQMLNSFLFKNSLPAPLFKNNSRDRASCNVANSSK